MESIPNLFPIIGVDRIAYSMKKPRIKRIIGKHEGQDKGPLLICIGGMHGNEWAGIRAIDMMSKMLEVEPVTNPGFRYRGVFLGLAGNVHALKKRKRYIEKDLNRIWTDTHVENVLSQDRKDLEHEDKEMFDLIRVIQKEVKRYDPERVIVLDLHTTTAYGGIFSIASDDLESLKIGVELHAPVITGLLKGIQGTSLHYFNKDRLGVETTCIVFESGQHMEELSVNRAIAAMTNVMSIIGAIDPEDVENRHESLLIEYARGLPKIADYIYGHQIEEGDEFEMMPGYKNFQSVQKGDLLAKDKNGKILAETDGLLLMPLYQSQGQDGFFIIKETLGRQDSLQSYWKNDLSLSQ